MYTNKQTALSLERQHLKKIRKYYLVVADINVALAQLHKKLRPQLDVAKYQFATDYIHQYVSYTTVWHLKFVTNLESPEVALMQIFHLEYIFSHEPADRFIKERAILQEKQQLFHNLNTFSQEHIDKRREKMMAFIQSCQNEGL